MPGRGHTSGIRNRIAAARLRATEAVTGGGMHISAAGTIHCRYIAGDGRGGFICGQPAEVGRSWCSDHMLVVFEM
jgi:hypothetical protein